MFIDSSKVKVVESTVKGKKTGPVFGSTGYVIPHFDRFKFLISSINESIAMGEDRTKPFEYGDGNGKNLSVYLTNTSDYYYLLREMDVFFTHFGSETKSRFERKPVINVFPYPKNMKKDSKLPEKYITEDMLGGINGLIEEIIHNMNEKQKLTENPPICVMVPHYTATPVDICTDINEYVAWCNSVIKNGLLMLYVHTAGDNNFFKQNAFFSYIKDYINQNNAPPKLSEIEKIAGKDKKEVVYNLRKLLISMVNNYDQNCVRELNQQNYFSSLNEMNNSDRLRAIGSQVWKLGFTSNRGMQIKKINGGKVANTIVAVQQDLLTRSTR